MTSPLAAGDNVADDSGNNRPRYQQAAPYQQTAPYQQIQAAPMYGTQPGGYQQYPGRSPYAPAAYGQAPPYPIPRPPQAKPRTGVTAKVIISLLMVAILAVLGVGAIFVPTAGTRSTGQALSFIDPDATGRAIRNLLAQREKAVADKDKAAFMAGVDSRDARFGKREETEFENLIKLQLDTFKLSLGTGSLETVIKPTSLLFTAFPGGVKAVPVTIHYAVHGVDTEPVAVPWAPVFGQVNGVWKLGGEMTTYTSADERLATSNTLPQGTGGQPWQGGPITVIRNSNVVILLSDSDADLGARFEETASKAVTTVISKVPTGWSKQIMVTAVNDDAVFKSYFAFSVDGPDQVAALAVPFYNEVPTWTTTSVHYASSRVIFNPDDIGDPARGLQVLLTHEFTHVALGPKTSGGTPLWLVEGIADYVGYTFIEADIPWDEVASDMAKYKFTALPEDRTFYDVGVPSYVAGWLMCRLISKTYGEAKLFALYDHFHDKDRGGLRTDWDTAIRAELGTSLASLETKWLTFAKHPS